MSERGKKFATKLSGDVRKKLYDLQKDSMVEQEAKHTEELVKREEQVKDLVQGEPILHLPYYIIFAKEIYKKQRKFKAWTLINEIEILEEKWRARGLDPTLLNTIKCLYVQAYKTMAHFRLNISKLDGPHILS